MQVYEPKRATYRKKIHTKQNTRCPFCDASIIRTQSISALQTTSWRVIVNRYPYLDGNLMLVPIRHVEHTQDLTKDEWADLKRCLDQSQKALTALFKTHSFNLGINLGEHSGRSIPHIHWMLLPRPRKHNRNCIEILNDLTVITVDWKTLKKRLDTLSKRNAGGKLQRT